MKNYDHLQLQLKAIDVERMTLELQYKFETSLTIQNLIKK